MPAALGLSHLWTKVAAQYAILSHRWEEEEVSFQAMQNLDAAAKLKGFTKIRQSCKQAVEDGHDYAWCDTCCIDKASSAELSEAINSMCRYYQAAGVCYVFLSDAESHRCCVERRRAKFSVAPSSCIRVKRCRADETKFPHCGTI